MLVYLASPYTHKSGFVRQLRYEQVLASTARLVKAGVHVYSPIVHNHYIAEKFGLPADINFWEQYDSDFLATCDELWVLTLDGWYVSKGIKFEVKIARLLDKPVRMIGQYDSRPHS